MVVRAERNLRKANSICSPNSSCTSRLKGFIYSSQRIRIQSVSQSIIQKSNNQKPKKGQRNTRTKPSHIRQLRRIVRHSSHHPIRRRLPHSIQQPTEDIEPNMRRVVLIVYIDRYVPVLGLYGLSCVVPIEV